MLCLVVGTLIFSLKNPIGVLCPVVGTLTFFVKNPYRGIGPCTVKTLIFHEKNPYRGVVPGGGDFEFFRKKSL